MATAKIVSLAIRTLAKPIATSLKKQAGEHDSFRRICINLAQYMHRSEMKLRTGLLGEPAQKIRPLNDAKAIANGANAISEGFLFAVAAALILGETWRSSRSRKNERTGTLESLQDLEEQIKELRGLLEKSGSGGASQDGAEETEAGRGGAGKVKRAMTEEEWEEVRRLAALTQVLLKTAVRNGWVAGSEGIDLAGIMGEGQVISRVDGGEAPATGTGTGPVTAALRERQQAAGLP